MKRLYSLAAAMGTAMLASAQLTGISVDVVTVHDGSVDPSLTGMTTYRVYADLTNEYDFVSAVFGDATYPLSLGCDGTIFHSATVNYNYANQVNAAFFGTFPTTEFDSWLTIGADDSTDGVNIQSTDDTMAPALDLFNAGEGFVINDPIGASWFNVYPCAGADDLVACAAANPGAFADADGRVLLAQITADGDIYGLFNLQIFPNGDQSASQAATAVPFSSNDMDIFGCTNPAAENYDDTATIDDLSCILPCTVELSLDNVTSPSCNGENDALIQVTATGFQGADNFYIGDTTGVAQNFGNFGNLISGMYNVYVVDAAGCIDSLEVEVPVTGEVVVNTVLSSPVSCNGADDAVLTVESTTGGDGDFTYYISTDPTVLTQDTEWTGLAGGLTYVVWAVDGNMCTGSSEPILVQEPSPINVALAPAGTVDASCANVADGEIYVVGLGGNAPATIQYSVDGMNYADSPLMVSGGTYTVTAQDVFGCIGTLETEVVIGPDAIDVNAMSMPEACFGSEDGEVSWAPGGGQGTYMYTFDGEGTTDTMAGGLAPGDYEVTVTDSEGCSETVVVAVEAGVAIEVNADVTDASCFGENDGEVTLTATGGTGAFQYSENGNNYSQNNTFDDLTAGTATFFVQDENGCEQTVDATIGEPEAIVVTAIVSEGSATGEGTIDVTVTGGSLPYTYEWIGPGVSGVDTQDLEGISSGAYTVEVTDANGCSTTEAFNITTSIAELAGGVSALVFPNPSSGMFQVNVEGGQSGPVNFMVVDAQGRTVRRGQWTMAGMVFRTTLDLGQEEAGVYRLIMENGGRPVAIPLMKTH